MREITLTLRFTPEAERAISRHDGLGGGVMTDDELRSWIDTQVDHRVEQIMLDSDDDEEDDDPFEATGN